MVIGIDASRANMIPRTGTEWYSFFIIRELLRNDRSNKYILYVKEPLVDDMKDWASLAEVRILRWPPKFLWNLFRLTIEMVLHPPDVLFVPAHTIPLICPRRTVTTCHDIGFERYPHLYANTPIGPKAGLLKHLFSIFVIVFTLGRYRNNELNYHRFSMRLAVRKAAKIITISQFSKRELISEYHANPDKMTVIYHGINERYRSDYRLEEIQAVLADKNVRKPYLFFIGRWEQKKNIRSLLAAFEQLRGRGFPHTLVLAGKPGWGFDDAWKSLPEEVKAHVSLLTKVHEEAPLLMAGADVFVFPSAYEGFGIPVIEAMKAGVPVVCSSLASLPEAAGNAALLINPEKPVEIADAIERIIQSGELRRKLVAQGFAHASQFSWERAGRETLETLTNW